MRDPFYYDSKNRMTNIIIIVQDIVILLKLNLQDQGLESQKLKNPPRHLLTNKYK